MKKIKMKQTIQVTRQSVLTRQMNTMELPILQEHLDIYDKIGGFNVQDIFPQLDAEQREFLINGVTPQEWTKYIGDYNDE